ncbi:MAG: putative Ig domain-containing protein, partial [Cyanobacteria bacterium MAG CAR3_bin_5]|nr:putative Ig domain-containing protein [Cyanobacteria bacterium MAG CAR3_bin_5]
MPGASATTGWVEILGTDADSTSGEIQIPNQAQGTKYDVRIRGFVGGEVAGEPSDWVTVALGEVAAPTGLTAVAGPGSGEVTLEWDDPGNGYISKYQLYATYVDDSGGTPITVNRNWEDIPSSGSGTTSYTVDPALLQNDVVVTFRVRAVLERSGDTQAGEYGEVMATPVASPLPVMSLREPNVESAMRVGKDLLVDESQYRMGSELSYTISSNVAVGSGVFVCVEVSESGHDRLKAGGGREGVFVAPFTDGGRFFPATLGAWDNDMTNKRPSRITIRLLPPSDSRCSSISADGYVVNPRGEDNTFSFVIADDDDLSVGLTSADDRMTEGVAAATAMVTVELGRRLYEGERAEVVLDLSSGTGAMLPDGDAMTKDDFVVTAAGTGVTGEGLDDDRLTLVFTGDDTDTVQTATLTFTPTDRDDGDSDDDTVTVALNTSNSAMRPGEAGLSGSPNSVNLTLEEPPVVTITNTPGTSPTVSEGAAALFRDGGNPDGVVHLSYRVTVTPEPAYPLTVNLEVADAADADYVLPVSSMVAKPLGGGEGVLREGSNTISFTGGDEASITYDVIVAIEVDEVDEPNGDVTVTVASGTGYTVGSASSASGTVTDDDATTVTLAGPAGDLEEGYSKTLSLSLSRALVNGEVLAVPLTFGAGTATRGTDYTIICTTRLPMGVTCNNLNTAASPTVTFTGPSAASVNLFLEGAYDTTTEPGGKTVDIGLALDASSGVNLGGGAVGVDNLEEFKIIDGIPPEVSISGVPADIFTTDPFTVTFTFSRLVDLGTQDLLVTGGAGSMFTKKGNVQYVEEYTLVVTPAGGEDVVVQVNRNGAQADNLVLGPPEAEIATARWNNAIPVFFSASRVEVTEGADSHAEVLVRLGTARPDETTIVALQYNGITAEKGADRDFVNGPGSVTIAAGETEATVRIPIIDDNAREGEESFAVNIPGEGLPRDSVLRLGSPPTVTVFITDDDEEALVFSPSAVTVDEGSSNTYTVKLATAPTGTVTVTVGGASGEVTVDTDSGMAGNQTTLTFSTTDWNTGKTVTVTAGEDVDITNDSATLTHTAAGGGYAGVTGNVAVTVTDDDTPTVSFAASSSTVAEDGGTKTIRINISPAPSSSILVDYDVSGTATEGTDFSSINSVFLVPANLSSIDVPVVVTDDSVDENGETVILTLSDGTGYRVGSPSVHTLTIADNDGANNAPTVATVIPDQNATAGTAFSYQFPANTFADADGDPLGYTATQGDDSALPTWLTFTANSRTFSGTPQAANVSTLSVKVTATDGNGGSISDTFNIVVSAATP